MPPLPIDPNAVFLNIPYDEEFHPLYIAYIVGLHQLGLVPRITSEIPGGERRLNRILALIQSCRYSIHDLSRVESSVPPTATPRFNMPLELGMTITWTHLHPRSHTWSVWESEPYRLQRSASDLNGTDPYIHSGTAEGVLNELRNAFWRKDAPSTERMLQAFHFIEKDLAHVLSPQETRRLYSVSAFKELCKHSLFIAELDRKKRLAGQKG